ncbi:CobW family GTP-binding protein [Clostridium saccharoperbutylacetonicum]|uniref:CobW family GTP-binding protein n=1 Tax=Clostridium saccharoperbutylacetonicum TaxID=36745 RepID=UPI0009838DD2|nr:CobW family GTP-binding protein [Clostridium saccharoperbutylacetonicum]AQR94921.1 putative GTP-binding protein YjiA [Clostridium saccharoperbutylacetonicum]NSB30763.1 G3E family GTPase [Clostridium saccharoperbutylacetonicum]
MTKIDIISGFLGAGKTTLIKKLIEEAFKGEKLMLIENEFGEIGIDGGFLNNSGVEITEMNSGCICCSLVGDFGVALKEALDKYSPERIIIEPSGVGKLSDVIKAVESIKDEAPIKLNSFTAVVDAIKCKMYMDNFGEFFNNQIENANTIVLSRTQKLTQEKLELCVAQIREHNKDAAVITTNWDEIDGKQILAAMERENSLEKELLKEAEEHHHHHHDEDCSCQEHEHHHHDDKCDCQEHEHHHHDEKCDCHDHEHHHHDEECDCQEHEHHHHHADEVFTSWGIETPKKYSKIELDEILKVLAESSDYGIILRAKGIIPCTEGGWINFDLVPGEYEIREGVSDYTGRLCVIGTNINKTKIQELFHI